MLRQLIFLLLISSKLNAGDFDFGSNLQQAYAEVLKLRISPGKALLAKEPQNNGLRLYIENYADIAYLLVSENPTYYRKAVEKEDERLSLLKDLDEKSPYSRFLQAEIHLHWAFVKLKFGHELSGCWDIIKAYRLLEENSQKFPKFLPNRKSLGLLHVLFGSAPKNYLWVTKLLGLRGDVQGGLREIQSVIDQDAIFQDESQLIDFLLHSYIIGMTEAKLKDLEQFVKSHPDNQMFYLFGASMLVKNNQAERALPILLQHPSGENYLTVPSFEYLKGEAFIQKGQYAQATDSYKRYLQLQKGHNFIKDANYKIYLSCWLSGKEPEGRPYLQQVLTAGKTITEPDKAAQKFAATYIKVIPSEQAKVLMKARLSFDGGFYEQALMYIQPYQENQFILQQDKAEFQYRKGRIFQKINNLPQAIQSYERAIVLSVRQGFSFGATSALQLGYIYEQMGQKQKARTYFEQALTYDNYEYKTSVDNKAKAALNELGE